MKTLSLKLLGPLLALGMLMFSFNAQAETCICHDVNAVNDGPLTLCYADDVIPPGHQDHMTNTPPQVVDTLGACAAPPDGDGDGVPDGVDLCPGTPEGESVDADGCSDSQKDDDGDGVNNDDDLCPGTPEGESVDEDGCSDSQKDDDGDFGDTGACADILDEGGCIEADKALFKAKNFKHVKWMWMGEAGDLATAGMPAGDGSLDDYSFCVYVNGLVARNSAVAAGAFDKATKTGWKTKTRADESLNKHKYKSKSAAPDGVKKVQVKNSPTEGKDKAKVKSLFPPEFPLDSMDEETIVVQLRNPNGGLCLQSTHTEPFDKSTEGVLKDKVLPEEPID